LGPRICSCGPRSRQRARSSLEARLERGTVRRFDARTQVGWPLAITVVT
jgi:hypothetical protein